MSGDVVAHGTPQTVTRFSGDVVTVAVDQLIATDSLRLSGVNEKHVQVLAQLDQFPPLLVHRASMQVIDGTHRLAAAKLLSWTVIAVQFFDGSLEAAFVEAVRINSTHGLPLTLADRRVAATRIVRMYPAWSDRMIAALVGLSGKTVGVVRSRMTEEFPQSNIRLGRDGRMRRIPTPAPLSSENSLEAGGDISAQTGQLTRTTTPSESKASTEALGLRSVYHRANTERFRMALDALSHDPSFRMTETGRFLLRLLNLHLTQNREWEQLGSNVPAHRATMVADLARECAKAWLHLAANAVKAGA